MGEDEGAPRALVGEQHHELVATDPVGGVLRAHRRPQALGQGTEARVAGLVAERVVDLLQAVEIEHHDAEARAGASAAGELALEVLVERTMVSEPVRLSVSAACCEARDRLAASARAAGGSRLSDAKTRAGEEAEPEEEREPDQLGDLDPVGRPVVAAAREDGFGTPDASASTTEADERQQRPSEPAALDRVMCRQDEGFRQLLTREGRGKPTPLLLAFE